MQLCKMQTATYEETTSKWCSLKYVFLEGNTFNTVGKILALKEFIFSKKTPFQVFLKDFPKLRLGTCSYILKI